MGRYKRFADGWKRFTSLPLSEQAAIVWPELGPEEGLQRIEVAIKYDKEHEDVQG